MSTNSKQDVSPDLPFYMQPRSARCPFDPAENLKHLQHDDPVTRVRIWDGSDPWLITKFDDAREVLTDSRVTRETAHPNYPHWDEGTKKYLEAGRTFMDQDGPVHRHGRAMLMPSFVTKRMEALRPIIQSETDSLLGRLLAGPKPVDLVESIGLPLPSIMISLLLGVPLDDSLYFQQQSSVLLDFSTSTEERVNAGNTIADFLEDLLATKRKAPTEDLISDLARNVEAGEMDQREAARMGTILLFAGHETTASMIAIGTLALLEHPDQLALLRDSDDPAFIANAVDELLRYVTITQAGRRRIAIEELEVRGHCIAAGEGVIVATDIANRDPDEFDDPDTLNLHRPARRHMAFGFGAHQCIGQPMAKVELQVVFGTLFKKIPTLQLAVPSESLEFRHDNVVYAVRELPVSWR
jgi:cytochrome P450